MGQATVEAVALWLLLAGLLALLGAWASSHMRPPASPPPLVQRAARPLLGDDRANGLPLFALVPRAPARRSPCASCEGSTASRAAATGCSSTRRARSPTASSSGFGSGARS